MDGIFGNILSIIAALLLLSVLVVVHEFGHFITAKLLGFRVLEFAVGMGPKLLGKTRGGTLFSLRALPIGGMCRFAGEDDDNAKPGEGFQAQKLWKRVLVVLAGPALNIILALLLGMGILMGFGVYTDETEVRIHAVSGADTPAAMGGMQADDRLLSINGKPVTNNEEALQAINDADPSAVSMVVERKGKPVTLTIENVYNEAEGRNFLGVSISTYYMRERLGLFEAAGQTLTFTWEVIRETFAVLGRLVTGKMQQGEVGGVVSVVATVSQAVRTNWEMVLQLAMLLNISLGIMNLLPIPALDGGRLLFFGVEAVRGKPISPEREGMVHFIGFALLMVLVVVLFFSDIRMLAGGG